jgi:hypothetical protein
MAEVLLSTVDLDVFGGPTSIDVSIDFGATGARGSRIWSGTLAPEQQLVGQEVQLFDYYINTTTAQVFQYVLEIGNPVWVPFFSLTLPQLSTITTTEFTGGVGQLALPTALINQYGINAQVTTENVVVRYNIEAINPMAPSPIASSFIPIVQVNPLDQQEYFIVTISGVQLDLSTGMWGPLSGNYKVHWFITFTGGGD